MAKEEAAGIPARRCLAICLILTAVFAVLPLTLREIASNPGQGLRPTGYTLAVMQALKPVKPAEHKPVPASVDAATLQEIFRARDYAIDTVRSGEKAVPRLVVAGLPDDMKRLDSTDERKRLFVKTMLPLVLLVNESIERDRDRLRKLKDVVEAGHALAPMDRIWVARTAARYKLDNPGRAEIGDLLKRVDVVPVSLALAQAAEESGWGTSRFAQDGNALFGQLTWTAGQQGIVPRNRRDGETHRFRSFDDLLESVRVYVHNLNTHDAYRGFRLSRASLRAKGKPLDSLRLVGALEKYSERGTAYVEQLRTLIRVNKLQDFDGVSLVGEEDGGGIALAVARDEPPAEAEVPAPAPAVPAAAGVSPRDR